MTVLPALGELVAAPAVAALPATVPAAPRPSAPAQRPRVLAIRGEGIAAYDAGNLWSPEGRDWYAYLASPDIEQNLWRDTIVARIRDLVRNDGWASGAIARITDSVIGGNLRLVAKPDYRALALRGGKAFDKTWADEFGRAAEALWRSYSNDPARWCDAGRRYTVAGLFRLAYRQKLVDGEALGLPLWLPERQGYGRARYSTALQLIDADRLSNPHLAIDTKYRRAGVEIDDWNAAIGYHIRQAHMGDWFNAVATVTWDYIARETEFGRPLVIHDFDSDRPGEHRGAGGVLRPVLTRMKMLSQYDSVELQAAVVNSVFAAYIESSADIQAMQDAMGTPAPVPYAFGGQESPPVPGGPAHDSRLRVGDGVLPVLRPGEKIVAIDSKRPSTGYAPFENAVLRNLAAAVGTTAEQLSQDWSRVNYSSARAALQEAWKTLARRRHDFAVGFCTPFYGCWLEEAIDRGELPMPAGAPDYVEARSEYSACRWMGPPRGFVDPLKEAQAAVLRMDAGLSTLEQECADQGLDWEEQVEQRGLERRRFEQLGLPHPTWMGAEIGGDQQDDAGDGAAADAAKKPVKPQPT